VDLPVCSGFFYARGTEIFIVSVELNSINNEKKIEQNSEIICGSSRELLFPVRGRPPGGLRHLYIQEIGSSLQCMVSLCEQANQPLYALT
jgi:hypothetical protein